MVQFPVPHRRSADDERTISDGFGHARVLFRVGEQLGSTDGGAGRAKCGVVGIHDAQIGETEIAHSASSGADVKRVARGHQDDAQTVKFRQDGQGDLFYRRVRVDRHPICRLRAGDEI